MKEESIRAHWLTYGLGMILYVIFVWYMKFKVLHIYILTWFGISKFKVDLQKKISSYYKTSIYCMTFTEVIPQLMF